MSGFLKGWRTLIIAALGLLWAALDSVGINVPLADQDAVATAILAVAVIINRLFSSGPVAFRKGEE